MAALVEECSDLRAQLAALTARLSELEGRLAGALLPGHRHVG
jgi:BMFP domain-containing protein YqiC